LRSMRTLPVLVGNDFPYTVKVNNTRAADALTTRSRVQPVSPAAAAGEHLQQQCPQHILGRDRRPPLIRIQSITTRRSTTAIPRPSACELHSTDDPEKPAAPTKHNCTVILKPVVSTHVQETYPDLIWTHAETYFLTSF
jgi:hypothetical protein